MFWVKMILGNHFPPNPHVWLQRKMKFSRNSFPVDQYLLLLHFYFRFKSFPEREREREREREKREPRLKRGRGKRESRRSTRGAVVRRARRESRRSTSSAIVRPSIDEQRDRRSRSSIAPLVGRLHRSHLQSRFSRVISSSPSLRDLNLTGLDEFFCWVLFLL